MFESKKTRFFKASVRPIAHESGTVMQDEMLIPLQYPNASLLIGQSLPIRYRHNYFTKSLSSIALPFKWPHTDSAHVPTTSTL